MLVYGDPQFEAPWPTLLARLRQRLLATRADDLDGLRECLIQTGQAEQAAFDAWRRPSPAQQAAQSGAAELTDNLAAAFVAKWFCVSGGDFRSDRKAEPHLRAAIDAFARIPVLDNPSVRVKVPEGFQFYALFPDQYCAAALAWERAHTSAYPKSVLVAGIRSIGTTLSAVAKATLEAVGWNVNRCTIRPAGHPFSRTVELPYTTIRSGLGLVVDEGPGLSGSSMSAAALALARTGVREVSFLPGHAGEPGTAASDEVRQCWARTPRYVTSLHELRWNGHSLQELLRANSDDIRDGSIFHSSVKEKGRIEPHTSDEVLDLSGGFWRRWAFMHEAQWPAVASSFERMKFLCHAAPGPPVLWKFGGLGCFTQANEPGNGPVLRIGNSNEERASIEPLRNIAGFVAMPWVEGPRLTKAAGQHRELLTSMTALLLSSAKEPMSIAEAQAAWQRLGEMLYWNTHESLGAKWAEQTRAHTEAARPTEAEPAYGDGRMAPWEWIATGTGALVKTDCGGHDCDHTLIGKQSVLWDLAGLVVEWDLRPTWVQQMLPMFSQRGLNSEPRRLRFYLMAYAAFRLGVMALAANQADLACAEEARLQRASEFYRAKLAGWVQQQPLERSPLTQVVPSGSLP